MARTSETKPANQFENFFVNVSERLLTAV
ncbi:MAG: hypothetical protein ACD_34C00053G0002, partial [uncultured bacterium]